MADEYDVFLSHNSADKAAVEAVARRLREETKLRPFLDRWHLVPGESWLPALERAVKGSKTVAVFFGAEGMSAWHEEEVSLALVHAAAQKNEKRIIPVLLPGARKEDVDGFLGLRTWVDLGEEGGFSRLVAGIEGRGPEGGVQKNAAKDFLDQVSATKAYKVVDDLGTGGAERPRASKSVDADADAGRAWGDDSLTWLHISDLHSRGDDDHNRLWVGRRALRQPAAELAAEPADLRIVAMHHPTGWLCGAERSLIRQRLRSAGDMIFTGHLHDADVFTEKTMTDATLHVKAGAAYQGSEHSCMLFFGDFDGTSIRLRPYLYADKVERWVVDPSVFPDADDHEGVFDGPVRGGGSARRRKQARGPGAGTGRPDGRGPRDSGSSGRNGTGDVSTREGAAHRRDSPSARGEASNRESETDTPWDAVGQLGRILEAGPNRLLEHLRRVLPEAGLEPAALSRRVATRVAELELLPGQTKWLKAAWTISAKIDALGEDHARVLARGHARDAGALGGGAGQKTERVRGRREARGAGELEGRPPLLRCLERAHFWVGNRAADRSAVGVRVSGRD